MRKAGLRYSWSQIPMLPLLCLKTTKFLRGFSPGGSIYLQNYRSYLNIHSERATLALMIVITVLLGFLCCLRNGFRECLQF
ncbi:hypothetical protein GIB67_031003 [Kingdonia uniflora]|uniref:Uncharacterized protein n=1 Tax=Kingdonia uniflora TaxID=39325 RepID=A0A7J7NG54_9MAGN|nr:hypothetical protein GIB67_031003 [Kingdonia uniflora]